MAPSSDTDTPATGKLAELQSGLDAALAELARHRGALSEREDTIAATVHPGASAARAAVFSPRPGLGRTSLGQPLDVSGTRRASVSQAKQRVALEVAENATDGEGAVAASVV